MARKLSVEYLGAISQVVIVNPVVLLLMIVGMAGAAVEADAPPMADQPASPVGSDFRDMRAAVASESAQNLARHLLSGPMPPKHDWRRQPPLRAAQGQPEATPGGIGYGISFDDSALLWTNSTIADYYVIVPTVLDGYVSTLYLTSTCRAQLGTESLICRVFSSDVFAVLLQRVSALRQSLRAESACRRVRCTAPVVLSAGRLAIGPQGCRLARLRRSSRC